MRILGVDYGTKHTGLALGETDLKTTLPLSPITTKNNFFLIEEIKKIVTSENIDAVVVGIPLNKDSKQADIVEKFITDLQKETEVRIEKVDEFNTSKESFSSNFQKFSKIKHQKNKLHSIAAENILNNYFLTI